MDENTNLSAIYDHYFAEDGGKSVYDGRFGDFDIPLIDCITFANLAANTVFHASGKKLSANNYDHVDFTERLFSQRSLYEDLAPRDFYFRIIKEVIDSRQLPGGKLKDISFLDYGCGDGSI